MRKQRRETSPFVALAHQYVKYCVRYGELTDLREGSTPCVDGAAPATCYDHRDYKKPLDVVPVCNSCNAKRGHGLNYQPRSEIRRVRRNP